MNCQLEGYRSDSSGDDTLKIAAKAVAETVNIAPARPAIVYSSLHHILKQVFYRPLVPLFSIDDYRLDHVKA